MKPTEEQQHAIDLFAGGGNVVVEALAGTGKALRNDQRVLTDAGWVPIGDVTINHRAYGSDGQTHAITGVFPQGRRPMFRLVMSDGIEIYADGDHRWTVENTFDRSAKPGFTARVMTTRELIHHGVRSPKGRAKWFLPSLAPIDRDDVALPIDPWLLGVILGDGCISASLAISMPDAEILARVRGIVEPLGLQVWRNSSDESCIDYRISSRQSRPGRKGFWNPLLDALNSLGLRSTAQTLATKSNVKFVPELYMRASAAQRLELLRGLLDTDGTRATAPNSFEFYSMSADLADAVVSLARSLGGTARRKSKRGAIRGAHGARYDESFRVYATFPSAVCPFWLPRKAVGWGVSARLEPFRTIASISPAPAAEATCIAVDAPDSLYVTEGYVLTHNTSTLRFMADVGAARGQRGLYAAFTKGVQLEAQRKFHGTGVQARTMHSLAFAEFGKPMQHRLGKQPPMRPTEKAQILGINDKYLLTAADGSGLPGALSRQQLVSYTGHTMKAFLGSTSEHVDPGMVYLPPTLAPKLNERGEARLRATIAEFAEAYWRDLQNPNGRMKYLPDAYLKSWYHSHPVLPFDYIMFDEAQDADDIITAVLLEQDVQIVAVGDRNQQIYSWRGAVDSMDAFGGERATLRKSFRFGPAIADYANGWLDAIGAPADMRLIPSDKLSTVRRRTPFTGRQPDGVLTRTNATAIDEIVTAQEEGIAVGIAGEKKAQELRALAQAAEDLQERGWTKHPELSVFNTWSEVRTHAESEDGEDLRPLVALVDRVGARQVGRAIDRCVPVQDARTTVSTAHVAKGLEWPQVHIADDFREPKPGEPMPAEEARLAYVAATRAMRFLDPYGLEWFERFRADGGVVAGAETPVSAQTGSTVATSACGGM